VIWIHDSVVGENRWETCYSRPSEQLSRKWE